MNGGLAGLSLATDNPATARFLQRDQLGANDQIAGFLARLPSRQPLPFQEIIYHNSLPASRLKHSKDFPAWCVLNRPATQFKPLILRCCLHPHQTSTPRTPCRFAPTLPLANRSANRAAAGTLPVPSCCCWQPGSRPICTASRRSQRLSPWNPPSAATSRSSSRPPGKSSRRTRSKSPRRWRARSSTCRSSTARSSRKAICSSASSRTTTKRRSPSRKRGSTRPRR